MEGCCNIRLMIVGHALPWVARQLTKRHFVDMVQPLLYMFMHLVLCQAATATAYIWWHSYWAHTAFLVACIGVSAWNGATYYFHVFAKRYLSSVGAAPHPHQS